MNQPQYVKGRDGKFKGSVGSGKAAPASKPAIPGQAAGNKQQRLSKGEREVAEYFQFQVEVASASPVERWKWAKRRNQKPGRLFWLAKDTDVIVREYVALNPKTPVKVLQTLAEEDNEVIRRNVALNPTTPPETLKRLLSSNEDEYLRLSVANNPKAPAAALVILAKDEVPNIRGFVAGHRNTPDAILVTLTEDEDPEVAKLAKWFLKTGVRRGVRRV